MPNSDAAHLAELRTWRDNLVAALKTPETASAFGGMPDNGGSGKIGRMGGRAQLLSELESISAQIAALEEQTENGPYLRESRGVT